MASSNAAVFGPQGPKVFIFTLTAKEADPGPSRKAAALHTPASTSCPS